MSKTFVTAMIVSCDTPQCKSKSTLLYPDELPDDWIEEHGFNICDACVSKRPCEHYDSTVSRGECDICEGLRCPDCLLLLNQQSIWWSRGGYGLPIGDPLEVRGHLAKCEWVKKAYPTAFRSRT